MVCLKIAILLFFIVVGVTSFNSDNFTPFAPNGADGVVSAASLIFFAYLISKLEPLTFLRFGIWMAAGLIIYFLYSRTHSALRDDTPSAGAPGDGPEGLPAGQVMPGGGGRRLR